MYVFIRLTACIDWTDIRDIFYGGGGLIKCAGKIEACLKSDKNIGNFIRRRKYVVYCWEQ